MTTFRMEKFLIIVITEPGHVNREAEKISALLAAGVDYVHIRKPHWSLREVRNLIEDIPYSFRRRLKLHGHFGLLDDFNLGGAHLNSRCPSAPPTAKALSRSCHTIAETASCKGMEYVTLSPVFDSISKTGYKSAFDLKCLKTQICAKNVIALGGVTPESIPVLRDTGFYGAAMLGYVWKDVDAFIHEISAYLTPCD